MRRFGWLLAVVLCLTCGTAWADDFTLPGLDSDANAYESTLTSHFPAGGTPAARKQSEAQAAAAIKKQDWPAAVAALERRIGQGDATSDQWMALAEAEMHRTPPDAKHALQAAWQSYSAVDTGPKQVPALLLMADALRLMDRPAQAIQALETAAELTPDNKAIVAKLDETRRATGILVRRVTTESEAEPPRACVEFTVAPVRRDDFHAEDWVKLTPPIAGAAVTREGDQICVSGLPSGATTRITLRAGMPGEAGLSLVKDTSLNIAMANRQPRIDFDTRMFLLPRGQTPAISLSTVNLSSVKLTLSRLTERNVIGWVRDQKLGQPVEASDADNIGEQDGRIVWQGSAAIPNWVANRTAHTALPMPDALASAGPGLYALIARAGDGTPNAQSAVQMILRTDFAPTVWRGADGLTVQVRGYSDVLPRASVTLRLLAQNNEILGETTTDADGVGRFAAPLLHGDGATAARAVEVLGGDDYTLLDLSSAAFDLSDRGVSGLPHPGPLDAYVWLDRGIYRPGETVQVMAIVRDDAGKPADIPVHVIIKRPNGQVYLDTTPARAAEASIHLPVALSPGAPAGNWSIEVKADPGLPPIGMAEFRVDAFVPDRMAVDIGPSAGPIVPGKPYSLPVTARRRFNQHAALPTGEGPMRLLIDPAPFPALAGYLIGLVSETYAPDATELKVPDTDEQGHATVAIAVPRAPDITHPLKASITIGVNDPSGHASLATTEIPLRPAGNLIGIKPAFADNAVNAGTEAGFDIAAVNPAGTGIALKARLRLVRERPDWRLVMHGSLARYETVWRDEPLETEAIGIPADKPFHFAKTLDFGRYRLEVLEDNGMAATSMRFRSGWVSSDNPDVPDQVDVSADRKLYAPGDTARIHISPPFAGQATVLVLTDRVHSVRDLAVPAGGTDVDVPVSADWGPGAYVTVHVFRTAADAKSRPSRAIGLAWVGIDPGVRKLPVTFEVPDKYPPRARAAIKVHATPGAWVSLAAVDEGILRLTRFVSPDPSDHFLGRRKLGLDIRDDWGRLIAPPDGAATVLHQGGDEGSFVLPEIPQKTVTLFDAPVQAGPDGVAELPLDFPDFNGQVRLMAVAWHGTSIGAASTDVYVRDPLVAEPLLPRFLAPGDQARLTLLLQDIELPAGEQAVTFSVVGPLEITGEKRLAATLGPNAQALPFTTLTATGAGRGVIHLDVVGTGGFHIQRETAILVRPARGATTMVAAGELAPGAEMQLAPPLDRFVPGTWKASATFGGVVHYDVAGLVQSLDDYPLWCLEQATSRGFPMALLQDGPVAGPDRAARLQQAVGFVLDRQRFDGGFGLWSASEDAEPWLSIYATEFLIRARQAGAAIPDQALIDAEKFVAGAADEPGDKPEDMAAQAYRLYVLALAGQGRPGAARVMEARLNALPTPLAKAQLGAALALAHDEPRAEAAFAAALAAPARKWWAFDYGTALRDQAAIAVLLKESDLPGDQLKKLIEALPGADLSPDALSTQEQSWAAAAGAVLSRGAAQAHIAAGGKDLPEAPTVSVALSGPASARNLSDQPVWRAVSVTGVPVSPLPAARSGMRITRQFKTLDGQTLDLDHLKQNQVFVLVLDGKAEDGQPHRAMVQQGWPAGWETAGKMSSGDVPGMAWLGKLSDTEAQPAADDRYAAVVALDADHPEFHLAVRVRAVTPGTFELPGAEVADMYRPAVFARQAAGRINIVGAE